MVLSLRYILPHYEFLDYKKQLVRLIDKAVSNNNQLREAELLELMGAPQNWKQVTTYKKP